MVINHSVFALNIGLGVQELSASWFHIVYQFLYVHVLTTSHVSTWDPRCTGRGHIFSHVSVLRNILGKYWETSSIFTNLHHVIDWIPVFEMLDIYNIKKYSRKKHVIFYANLACKLLMQQGLNIFYLLICGGGIGQSCTHKYLRLCQGWTSEACITKCVFSSHTADCTTCWEHRRAP